MKYFCSFISEFQGTLCTLSLLPHIALKVFLPFVFRFRLHHSSSFWLSQSSLFYISIHVCTYIFLPATPILPQTAPGNSSVNNNNNAVASNNNTTSIPNPGGFGGGLAPVLKPAHAPLKKHRAPAPPPQAGVAAATVSVIRQSSFLYGGAAGGSSGTTSIRPQSQPPGIGPRNSTVY